MSSGWYVNRLRMKSPIKPPREANGTVTRITRGWRKLPKRAAISRNDITTAKRKFN